MKRLFLDLEGTVIDDIEKCIPLDNFVAKIRKFIELSKPDVIETFSWAFWSGSDLAKWDFLKNWIKRELGMAVSLQGFDVKQQRIEFLESILGHVRPGEEFDFGHLANKERVFEWFVRREFDRGTCILIDDTVPDKSVIFNGGGLVVEFINVASL